MRAATSFLLSRHGYRTEIYASGEELLEAAGLGLGSGCILLDVSMPGLGGNETLRRLSSFGPVAPVIMMSGHGDIGPAVEAMRLGASDFLAKPHQEPDLIAAIERALDQAGRIRDRHEAATTAVARLQRLSPRERQVLRGLLAGLTNKEIARRLDLSPRTVEMHRANMMETLGTASLSEALRLGVDADLAPLGVDDSAPIAVPPSKAVEGDPPRVPSPPHLPPALDLLEGTTDCAFLLDPKWRFIYLNRNAEALIGRGRDLRGCEIWEAFPLARGTRGWDQLNRVVSTGRPCRFEFFEPDLEMWLDVSARAFSGGVQVFFRDVSAQRKAAASLRMSEEALRLALEAAGDGAWDWNIVTANVAMSERFLERLGYRAEQLPSRFETVRQLIHPDDLNRVLGLLNAHLEGRTARFSCEYRIRRADGTWCWVLDRGRVVARDATTGLPSRMLGSACDISDLKSAEQRAQEASERLGLALRNAGAGTWDLDLDSQNVRLCPRSRELHGLPEKGAEQFSVGEWERTVDPEDLPLVKRALDASVADGSLFRAEYRTVCRAGTPRRLLGLGKVVRDAAGRPSRFVGLNQDLTEQAVEFGGSKPMHPDLLHHSRLNAMGIMAATLAHELSQPLTAIMSFARGSRLALIESGLPLDAAVVQAVSDTERSAAYAVEIIRRVRAHASFFDSEKRSESLRSIVEEACRISHACRPQAVPEMRLDETVDRVVADRIQIEQVLLNLLRNGHESVEETDGDSPLIVSSHRLGDDEVKICIADRGTGISDEVMASLFTPFETAKVEGHGIGLSICRTIVEGHGGRIWVEDNPLGGAVFCFTLKLPSLDP